MSIHIHQGGTVRTYCGLPLIVNMRSVGWESAHRATCPDCEAAFEHYEGELLEQPLGRRIAALPR